MTDQAAERMTEHAAEQMTDQAAERMTDHIADRHLLRLLASILVVLWAAIAIAVATAYRPGGPLDIVVALACFLPVLVADAGFVWPASGLRPQHRTALLWVWIAAVLFAVPILYGVGSTLAAGGPQSLVPSFEEAYAAALALAFMAFFSIVGLVHRRRGDRPLERRATLAAAVLAVLLTVVVGLAFVLVAVVNDQSLRQDLPASSRFGPTDPDVEPPFCDEPIALGPNARISLEASSSIDDEDRGGARLIGRRSGQDESWSGSWDGPDGSGRLGYVRVGQRAWLNAASDDPRSAGTNWSETTPDPFALLGYRGLTMDGPPHAVADAPRGAIVAEDLGLIVIEGARARHCRTFIDGNTALDIFLPLRWLLYDGSHRADDAIGRWRGALDWWVFADGELGMASVEVSGSRAETDWDAEGVRVVLRAQLEATDRDRAVDLSAPRSSGATAGAALESEAP
ncbi:MAG: hypothetical protein R6W93_01725 [Candidatus Limnocylindrales bacterium]